MMDDPTSPEGAEPSEGDAPESRSPRRGLRAALAAGAALVIFLLGLGAGSAGDPTDSAEYRALESELADVTDERDRAQEDLQAAEEAAQAALDEASTLKAEAEEHAAALAERESQLEAGEAALADREAAVVAAEAEAAAAAAASAQDRQVADPVQAAPATTDPKPSNVYYKNCTAARDAGAAPVRRGDPGYGKHLDRDGDGVGCE